LLIIISLISFLFLKKNIINDIFNIKFSYLKESNSRSINLRKKINFDNVLLNSNTYSIIIDFYKFSYLTLFLNGEIKDHKTDANNANYKIFEQIFNIKLKEDLSLGFFYSYIKNIYNFETEIFKTIGVDLKYSIPKSKLELISEVNFSEQKFLNTAQNYNKNFDSSFAVNNIKNILTFFSYIKISF
jgi:hypothetical protein